MTIVQKVIASVLLILLTISTGFLLNHYGKPYHSLIFNIHKLISLVFVIFTALFVINLLKGMKPEVLIIIMIILAILSVIVLFVSGAFMSIGKLSFSLTKLLHNVALITLLITSALSIYLLLMKE